VGLAVTARLKAHRDKLAFFRQSGWMVIATVAGGVFMSAVHMVVNKPMTESEYAVFFALLRVFLLMGIPAGGLQVVFAQQAAAAVSELEERKLAQTTRAVLRATFFMWLAMAAVVFVFRSPILTALKIINPAALWVTVLLGLASLWAPIGKGILQGTQNFAGLGWVLIMDGIGRFTGIVLIVQLGGQAAGAMTGALIGQAVSLTLGAVLIWRVVSGQGAPFSWRPWLKRVIPLTIGVGVILVMSNIDVVYVQTVFAKGESPFYAPGAMIGLALVTFTTPLAAVMFPKIVQSAARTQKTDALRQALATTTLLAGAAALACTLFPKLPLRIIYFRNPVFWQSAPLVPWFAWCLLPLILANVLVSNLLARERFRVVPWLLAIGLGYGATLLALREQLVLFSARDVLAPTGLIERFRSRPDPQTAFVWSRLDPAERERLNQLKQNDAQVRLVLAGALNSLLKGPLLYQPAAFARVPLSEQALKLIEQHPEGKELLRANRLLLQEAFPSDLIGTQAKLFESFERVIGTLGVFSSLLLVAAMWFTFKGERTYGLRPITR
jgi:O-antigen/teichoic acid export membrane protein